MTKEKNGQQALNPDFFELSATDPLTVFHKIANQLDQDKRLIYKAIKNVQKMMKIEDE